MRHGSLFSGIGGFDLAAQWMGWENVFHCEINPFGRKVLNYYWPNAISYEDIKTTDFTPHAGKIDVLSGGFPCQPYSLAGKRKGKEDDRHLWPHMLAAIRTIQPRWIVGENVHGIVNWSKGMVFNEIQTDLETAGYETFAYVLPACGIDAPHRRDRTWFVAHAYGPRHRWLQQELRGKCESSVRASRVSQAETFANSNDNGRLRSDGQDEINPNKRGEHAFNDSFQSVNGFASDAERKGPQGNDGPSRAIRPEPRITESIPGFENFPTVSPFCDGNDGLSSKLDGITFSKWRKESIMAGGNAVVPQVVYQLFQTIQQYEFINSNAGSTADK